MISSAGGVFTFAARVVLIRLLHRSITLPTSLSAALALSAVTKHIGFVATASTTYEDPYLLARKFASLDHISKGRAAWNVVTTSAEGVHGNFGFDAHPDPATRYERAHEFVDVVKGLWDSFDDDAFLRDKASGVYLDPDKLHPLNHIGKHLKVKGPLNVCVQPPTTCAEGGYGRLKVCAPHP